MNSVIVIQSNSITLKDRKVLMTKNQDNTYSVPGGAVFEGEDPENACKKRAQGKIKIIKPLNSKISCQKIQDRKIPMISLNYLTKVQNV